MSDHEEARSNFEKLTGGLFSPIESAMGQERYQAEVKMIESNANVTNAHANLETAKANLYDTFRGVIAIFSVVGLVPLVVEIYRFIKG